MPKLTSDDAERRVCEFFARLYANAEGGHLEVRCLKPDPERCSVSEWFPLVGGKSSYRHAYRYMLQANEQGFDVFFGVNPRVNGGQTDKDVLSGCAVWVDIDDIPTLQIAEDRLNYAGHPMPPDLAVFSGQGLHVYWVVSEPRDPADDGFVLYRKALKSACGFYGGDLRSTNISRVLRFPLSYSHKRGCFTKLWLMDEA